MLYIPHDGRVWDTFLMKKDDVYHLFHLRFNSALGHAVSTDLAHWKEEPMIEFSIPGSWHAGGATLTGAVLEHEGAFWYAVGCMDANGMQVYGFAKSDDLYNWTMVDADEPSIVVGSDYYEHDVRMGASAWRDTAFRKDDEGWIHCYMCASTQKPDATTSGACIGHIRSKDLKHWEYLPPVAVVGDKVTAAECPSILEINGKWYLTFVDHGSGGMRWHTSGYEDTGGTYYMAADAPDGPYYYTKNPLLLGFGCDRQESWAGRAALIDGKWLIYSHTSSKTTFANLKEIVQSEDGGLELRYFPAIENLAIDAPVKIDSFARKEGKGPRGYKDLGVWTIDNGVLAGECPAMGSAVEIAADAASFILDADVVLEEGAALGFVMRLQEYEGVSRFAGFPAPIEYGGIAVRLDYELQRVEIEELARVGCAGYGRNDFMNSTFVRNPDRRAVSLKHGEKRHLKIIARDVFYEVYLDDIFLLCKQLGTKVSGAVEVLVERGSAKFENITITAIEPL